MAWNGLLRVCSNQFIRWRFLIFLAVSGGALVLLYQHLLPRPRDSNGVYVFSAWRGSQALGVGGRVRQRRKANQTCVHPVLNPSDPSVMEYHRKEEPVRCPSDQDWVYTINGTVRISPRAKEVHGDITCKIAPIVRIDDFNNRRDYLPDPMQDGQQLESDFFSVSCTSPKSGKKYENIHSAVAWNPAVHQRLRDYAAARKKTDTQGKSSSPHEEKTQGAIPSGQGLNLSVFMYGFDSMSHMAWLRNLPKSRDYFLNTLGGLELEGYNIVGDGTPAALLPILTGKMEEELPEARRGFSGARTVDSHPWIWKDFSRLGYVTAWAEDMVGVGTFQYRMLGFKDQPTDHCMRPFYLMAEKEYKKHKPFCLGSTPRHINFMRWFRSLFDMYRDYPKFFFGFHSELSHGDNNLMQKQDDDLKNFLQGLEESGHLNSTLLILMSDHGARFGFLRATAQGKLEERMAHFSFRFPPWFSQQHPDIIRNLKTNVHRLTTPFDIHQTFLEVLNYTGAGKADIKQRGVSLFKEVPKNRRCLDAEVTPHWCACLDWEPVSKSNERVRNCVQAAIDTINHFTQSNRNKCVELVLANITQSSRYQCTDEDSKAQQKISKYWTQYKQNRDGRFDGVSCSIGAEYYQVSFITNPGGGHFEAICYYDAVAGTFKISDKEISRINKYGSQPACIQDSLPHLRPYCYCASK